MDENELDEVLNIFVDEVNWGKKNNFYIIVSINLYYIKGWRGVWQKDDEGVSGVKGNKRC